MNNNYCMYCNSSLRWLEHLAVRV